MDVLSAVRLGEVQLALARGQCPSACCIFKDHPAPLLCCLGANPTNTSLHLPHLPPSPPQPHLLVNEPSGRDVLEPATSNLHLTLTAATPNASLSVRPGRRAAWSRTDAFLRRGSLREVHFLRKWAPDAAFGGA